MVWPCVVHGRGPRIDLTGYTQLLREGTRCASVAATRHQTRDRDCHDAANGFLIRKTLLNPEIIRGPWHLDRHVVGTEASGRARSENYEGGLAA